MVAWLKILLPLTALAILSTLFLVSRSIDPTLALPISDGDLQDLASEPRIGKPSFSGVMANGSAITLSAEQAIPIIGSGTGLRASGLRGVFQTPDGGKVDITATTGILDNTERTASLSGGVSLITSNGYTITTDAIIANLETAAVSTDGSILANGPLGHVSAGKLILQQKTIPDTENTYELVFTEGVKLIYTPHNP